MDGFTAANVDATDPTGARAMAHYGPNVLPFYYGVARTFGIGDRYFASVPGPTYPNRYYLVAGTSFGHVDNTLPPAGGWTQKTIFNELDAAHITWKIYKSQLSVSALLFKYVQDHAAGHVVDISQYYADTAAGRLPQVAFIDPTFIGKVTQEDDEHPPANPQLGQQFSAKVVHALMAGPDWPTSMFIQTWDEHGGYYDQSPRPRRHRPTTSRRSAPRARSTSTASGCRCSSSRRGRGRASSRTSSTTTRASSRRSSCASA